MAPITNSVSPLALNMAFTAEDRLQGGLAFAIIDEVDSILIDEARTPLIISGASEETQPSTKPLIRSHPRWKSSLSMIRLECLENLMRSLLETTWWMKKCQAGTDRARHQKVEDALIRMDLLQPMSPWPSANLNLLHHVHAALKAHNLYNRDDHYDHGR